MIMTILLAPGQVGSPDSTDRPQAGLDHLFGLPPLL